MQKLQKEDIPLIWKKTFFIDTNWHFLNYKELSHFRNEKVAYSYEVESSTATTMYLFKEI